LGEERDLRILRKKGGSLQKKTGISYMGGVNERVEINMPIKFEEKRLGKAQERK